MLAAMAENLQLERVVLGAKDLASTETWLGTMGGLHTVEQWWFASGLSSRFAYAGGAAIEVLSQAFPGAEMVHPLVAQIHGRTILHDCWLTWVVVSDDIDATAARLGLEVLEAQATASTGQTIAWRMVGAEQAFFSEPYLPYFVGYTDGADWKSRALVPEPKFDVSRVELSGDPNRLEEWLGGADLPVRMMDGPPHVRTVVVSTPGGDVDLAPPA